MRRSFLGGALFASSFCPMLAMSVLIINPGGPWTTTSLAAAALMPILLLLLLLRAMRQLQVTRMHSIRVRSRDDDSLAFVSAYVIPLSALFFGQDGSASDWTILLIIGFASLIYVRGGHYHLNPTLTLLGYRLYDIEIENGSSVLLFTRAHHLPQRGEIDARRLAEGLLVQL